MKQKQIDTFFKLVDREFKRQADIILTGASAASLMGNIRPSLDIDFEIRTKRKMSRKVKEELNRIILKASRIAGVATDYSEDISHWSMVDYLDYRHKAIPYKMIGKLRIRLMAPYSWTIGKMARFWELDRRDVLKIIRAKKLKPKKLITIWQKAVYASDLSLELGQFQEHVRYFLKKNARKLWGKSADPSALIREFEKKTT